MPRNISQCIPMVLLSLATILLASPSTVLAEAPEDWPRWRGPRGDGTWFGPPIPDQWPAGDLKQVWRQPLGGGYAGVTVAGDRLYVMDRQKEPDEIERILCFNPATGDQIWKHAYPAKYDDLPYGNGPRAAVTVDGQRIYAQGSLGHLHCLEAATGKLLWSAHLVDDFNGRLPMWGYAASPFIVGNLLVVQPGAEDAAIVALDKETGKVVWRALGDPAGYSTPMLFEDGRRCQLIVWTPENIRSLDPQTGKLHWSVPYEVTYGVAIATPIVHRDIVVVAGYWEGTKAIRLGDGNSDHELLWEESRHLRGLMSQPLARDGHVYLLDKQYGLTCFDVATGKKLWDDKNTLTPRGRNPQASLVRLGDSDRILALNADGELVLARIDPAGYHELQRRKIIGETWAHPAYAGRRVYARSDTELVCVELPVVRDAAE